MPLYCLSKSMSRNIFIPLVICIVLNVLIYGNIAINHTLVPLHRLNYEKNSHHFLVDERIHGGSFNFLRALGQFDAQWYLKIAAEGYPKNPSNISMVDKTVIDGLSYAFFPLYPLILSLGNTLIGNIELTAFIVANITMGAIFFSLYYIMSRIFTPTLALKTIFLILLFPFSIFFRSYFSEGIFLFLLVWYSYFVIKKQWEVAALTSSLLYITRPTGLFLIPLTLVLLANEIQHSRLRLTPAAIYMLISFLPFGGWMIFNYLMTGDPTYWMSVQQSWFITHSVFDTIRYNLTIMANFFQLPVHDFHLSRIDTAIFIYAGLLVYSSRKFLKREFWWMSFILWLFPLLTHDTISYSRYQSVNFPLFIYLAHQLKGAWYILVSVTLYAFLLLTSLFFVNWHWVG